MLINLYHPSGFHGTLCHGFNVSPAKIRAIATGLNKFAKEIEGLTKTARPKRGKP